MVPIFSIWKLFAYLRDRQGSILRTDDTRGAGVIIRVEKDRIIGAWHIFGILALGVEIICHRRQRRKYSEQHGER